MIFRDGIDFSHQPCILVSGTVFSWNSLRKKKT